MTRIKMGSSVRSVTAKEAMSIVEDHLLTIIKGIRDILDKRDDRLNAMKRTSVLREIRDKIELIELPRMPESDAGERILFVVFNTARKRGNSRSIIRSNAVHALAAIRDCYSLKNDEKSRDLITKAIKELEEIQFPSMYYK